VLAILAFGSLLGVGLLAGLPAVMALADDWCGGRFAWSAEQAIRQNLVCSHPEGILGQWGEREEVVEASGRPATIIRIRTEHPTRFPLIVCRVRDAGRYEAECRRWRP
jgi:hypothetical protein